MQNLLGKVENKLEGMGLKMLVMRHFMGFISFLYGEGKWIGREKEAFAAQKDIVLHHERKKSQCTP